VPRFAKHAMNFFCRVLGHTWVPIADNPKTNWNVDKTGQLLEATPASSVRFYDQCARCKERREATVTRPRAGTSH
jgi:hypothetical protein